MEKIKIFKISAIKREMDSLGIGLSLDNIRKLTARGIVTPMLTDGGHRVFNEEQFNTSVRNLILYHFSTPIKDILENNPEVIAERIRLIKKALRLLT